MTWVIGMLICLIVGAVILVFAHGVYTTLKESMDWSDSQWVAAFVTLAIILVATVLILGLT